MRTAMNENVKNGMNVKWPTPWAAFQPDRIKKVLLIEDDPTLEPVFNSILEGFDSKIEMDWVTSGEDAIHKLEESRLGAKESPYDLIIADIFLEGPITGVDFWDLCQNVYPDMPVLVMSGLPLHRFFEFIGSNNVCPPFLQKPLRLAECRETMKRILGYGTADGGISLKLV